MAEDSTDQFEKRKSDHIRISLDERSQGVGQSGLEQVQLIHEAIPDMNFEEVSVETSFFSRKIAAPFFISSMTAGHQGSLNINRKLAELSERKQILMGVGSQRKELNNPEASREWLQIRKDFPKALLISNIGISQLIDSSVADIQRLVENLEAQALFIHVNPLQEVLQPEGTTRFAGSFKAIEQICKALSVPVIVKEVGMGFSAQTMSKLNSTGVYAVDVAGRGGTHWGRVEGFRSSEEQKLYAVSQTFKDWGHSTLQSLLNAKKLKLGYKVWASGGIRNGLDVAKCVALGAEFVGLAQPWLKAVAEEKELVRVYEQFEYELKVALFCTGSRNLAEINSATKYEVSDALKK